MEDIVAKFYQYYYLVFILQAICAIHSIRRGTQQKWIWIIVFLPFIGSIAYIFTEMISSRQVSNIQNSVDAIGAIVNSKGRIADLEKRFKYSETFVNRVALADAYLANKEYQKAIDLYEPGLTGSFVNDEHVIKNLMDSYFHVGQYEKQIVLGKKMSGNLNFSKTRTNLNFALALEKLGRTKEAEEQFRIMNHRFANYEARCCYGSFLQKQNRIEDAVGIYNIILEEAQQLNRKERSTYSSWISKAKEELNRIESNVPSA